ncbi:ATP-binding protein [Wenyingzhuangia sp. IMCC45574]
MKHFFCLTFLVCTLCLGQKKNIYSDCFFLSDTIECNTITSAIKHLQKGDFTKPFGNNIYHKIPKGKFVWFYFKTKAHTEDFYFTIANSYLHHGKVFSYNPNGIDSLATINYYEKFGFKNIFYRHPTWKLKPTTKDTYYLIQIKDDEPKARLELFLNKTNSFLKRVQLEYFLFGTTITFLASLILIILALLISQKRYSLAWYGGFIFFIITTILANKGIGVQYIWSKSDFLVNSAKSFSQTLATMCAAFFYANFYPLHTKRQSLIKKVFFAIGYICSFLTLVYIYKIFFGGLEHWYLFVWVILKVCLITIALLHVLLLVKKTIPAYLAIGFTFSIVGTFFYQLYNPTQNNSHLKSYFFSDIFYLTIILELILVMYYIISEIVKGKLLAAVLKEENIELKSSMKGIEDTQKQKFSSNVHDTFGSYIEALSLQVKINPDTEKLNDIISSFRSEYQILLTNMFTPKVDETNFTQTIQSYCDKMQSLTYIKFDFKYHNKKGHSIPKVFAEEIYKIITELTNNTIKHSQADSCFISFECTSDYFLLNVKDNGIGFSPDKIRKKGIGLESIKSRTEILGGEFTINTKKNKGSTFTVTLPVTNTSSKIL